MTPRFQLTGLPRALRLLAALPLLFVLACGGGDDDPAPTATVSAAALTPPSGNDASPTATQAAAPTIAPTEGAPTVQERESTGVSGAARYADMTYTITKAVITNAVLRTYDSSEEEPGDAAHVVLHLTVQNELTGRRLTFEQNYFSLDVDGSKQPSVRVPGQGPFAAEPASTVDVLIAFEVEEDLDFADAGLIVAQPGTEPAVIPLSGEAPPPGFPFSLDVATGDQQVTSGNPCGTTMVVTPLTAEVDLDARIDGMGTASAIDGTRRAAIGERFLRIEMRATGDSGQCGARMCSPRSSASRSTARPAAP